MDAHPALPGLSLPAPQSAAGPVAVVQVAGPATHLDQEFDYLITPKQRDRVRVGQRVTVQLGPHTCPGFIVAIKESTSHTGHLRPLRSIVSELPVLTSEIMHAARQVAAAYAGGVSDVLRLAIPPRHARAEKTVLERECSSSVQPPRQCDPRGWSEYQGGTELLDQLAHGQQVRAVIQSLPGMVGDSALPRWQHDILMLTAHMAQLRKRSIIVVPAARQVGPLVEALQQLGLRALAYGSNDSREERYRTFVQALLGQVDIVVGTRSAVWAPLPELGLTIICDEADPLLRERHAPRPQIWRIAAARAGSVVYQSIGRSVNTQLLVERAEALDIRPTRAALRHAGARVIVADSEEEPGTRIPSQAFRIAREALASGPVLMSVPRAGYVRSLRCANCGQQVRCPQCAAPADADSRGSVHCAWAGHRIHHWTCPQCGGHRYRSSAIGSERTAHEIGRAFPGIPVRISGAHPGIVGQVENRPSIIVATPGAEPVTAGGYCAAIVLDGAVLSARTELAATAHITTQLATIWSLVRPADQGGRVALCGLLDPRVSQAMIRADYAGFARELLNERAELHLPPIATVAELRSARGVLRPLLYEAEKALAGIDFYGPIVQPDSQEKATLCAPPGLASTLRQWVREVVRTSSVRGTSAISATIDPSDL